MKYSYINVSDKLLEKWMNEDKIYIGDCGMVYCKKCNTLLTLKKGMFYIVRQCVDCDAFKEDGETFEKLEEWKRQQKIKNRKKQCFFTKRAMESTFEKGNLNSEGIFDVLKYCQNFKEYKKRGMGLLLYGGVGVGKTYLANAVAHRLIEQDFTCLSTNFSRLYDEASEYRNKQLYIDSLVKYQMIVIDDLGAERKSPQMLDFAYKVIDTLYGNVIPVIYTTNLSPSAMKSNSISSDSDLSRIYSRVINTTVQIEIKRKRSETSFNDLTQRETEKYNINLAWQGKLKPDDDQ